MFKAMLAPNEEMVDLHVIKLPKLMSHKLDGVRAMVQDGKLVTRNLKLIPNLYLQKKFGQEEFNGLDGELIFGDPTADDVFRVTSSAVMSEDGEPDATFHVFDRFGPEVFQWRHFGAGGAIGPGMKLVPHTLVETFEHMLSLEKEFLDEGYEGGMLRDPNGRYKEGRATVKENLLLKLKRFKHSEAFIIGFEEQMHNGNEKTLESNGKAKRSHHKAGLTGKGTLGAFIVKCPSTGLEFNVATGSLTADEKQEIWNNRAKYTHQVCKYKYFPKGIKTKPRFPQYEGVRDLRDM